MGQLEPLKLWSYCIKAAFFLSFFSRGFSCAGGAFEGQKQGDLWRRHVSAWFKQAKITVATHVCVCMSGMLVVS